MDPRSCRAKACMCEPGKGTKPPLLRKSKTERPRSGVTMQMWPRQSKQSRSCMHRFVFFSSAALSVCSTRSSMRLASRYYTKRSVLNSSVYTGQAYLGHGADDLYCHLFPTPSVDCPHDFPKGALSQKRYQAIPFAELAILLHDVVSVFVVNLLVGLRALLASVSPGSTYHFESDILTSGIDGTTTSFCFFVWRGGVLYSPYSAK